MPFHFESKKNKTDISFSDQTNSSLISRQATNWFRGLAILFIVISHYADCLLWFTLPEGNAELFRLALAKLGDYGVVLFFLFSGYGLVKSLKGGRVTRKFLWKRIRTVYFPYLIIVGIMELLSGSLSSRTDIANFLTCQAYWYLVILFTFYIVFMILWAVPMPKWLRVMIITSFTFILSWKLYSEGKGAFWFCSNFAFPLGILIAEWDRLIKRISDKIGHILIPLFAIIMIFIIRSGLGLNGQPGPAEFTAEGMLKLSGAQFIWCLLIVFVSGKLTCFDPILSFLGKNSLYLYLTHGFIFRSCAALLEGNIYAIFASAASATLAVSAVCWIIFDLKWRTIFQKLFSSSCK